VRLLILGGTGWLGRVFAAQAVVAGHAVTCLARGISGVVPEGVEFIRADREDSSAYSVAANRDWDCVLEVSWQPGWVRDAVTALGPRARHWIYVSSGNVYARHDVVGADEAAELLSPTAADRVTVKHYGQAKVASELIAHDVVGDRLVIARAGLVGGPGDVSGRSGYWVARAARDPQGPMLVPDTPTVPTQVVDVRDLASWLLTTAERGITGTFNAVGPVVSFADWLALARSVAGHQGPVVAAPAQWLLDHGVNQYMGPESLPMWFSDPSHAGWSARSGEAASQAGLTHRPRAQIQQDLLEWETRQGLDRARHCGLSPARERELLTAWAQKAGHI
jgi:2'-hydroxyisoflavone reductase